MELVRNTDSGYGEYMHSLCTVPLVKDERFLASGGPFVVCVSFIHAYASRAGVLLGRESSRFLLLDVIIALPCFYTLGEYVKYVPIRNSRNEL